MRRFSLLPVEWQEDWAWFSWLVEALGVWPRASKKSSYDGVGWRQGHWDHASRVQVVGQRKEVVCHFMGEGALQPSDCSRRLQLLCRHLVETYPEVRGGLSAATPCGRCAWGRPAVAPATLPRGGPHSLR